MLSNASMALNRQPAGDERRSLSCAPPSARIDHPGKAGDAVSEKFVGVIQRLSLTGGSAILSKGPISQGSLADMALSTVGR